MTLDQRLTNGNCMIDTSFDFRFDTPTGKDPDTWSPTLLRYHQLLWSKVLPNGKRLDLEVTKPPPMYLRHRSELGEFWLSSDAVVPSFRYLAHITDQIPADEHRSFMHIGYTIGGMMVFPANRVNGRMTINGARGCHPRIRDRFDLTVECIRRHYLDEKPNPLGKTLALYNDFFELFGDFVGYVEFFLLQDLVDEVTSTVEFMMPFDNFTTSPVPGTLDTYREYRRRAVDFIEWRNRRIAAHTTSSEAR